MKLKHLFLVVCTALVLLSCTSETQTQGELVTVKLTPSFISLNQDTDVPMNVKSNVVMTVDPTQVIYAIQVYENDSAYYYGVFDNIDSMKIALTTGKTYRFKVATYKVGTGNGLKQDVQGSLTYFYLPNKTLLGNKFIKGNALKDINLISSAKLTKTQVKDYPEIDAFYCDKSVKVAKGLTNIDFNLLRMGFGVTFNVDTLTTGKVFVFMGNDTITLTATNKTATSVRLFNTTNGDFVSIFNNATTYADSILIKAEWVGANGTTINTEGKFNFTRNYQKTINIQLNTANFNLNFEDWNEDSNTVTDVDGNVYHTITIGTQTWMVENLKTTKYRDGSTIANVTGTTAWATLSTGAWCYYNNDANYDTKYGKLYNWYAVDDIRNIAPVGWHVPSNAEWKTLEDYVSSNLGTSTSVAKALASNTGWTNGGDIGTSMSLNNSTGFNALAGSYRYDNGTFNVYFGNDGEWWTSTKFDDSTSLKIYLYYGNSFIGKINNNWRHGFSVRCLKDSE